MGLLPGRYLIEVPPSPAYHVYMELANNTWIIIPAYNEAKRIGKTVAGVIRHWPHVVVIDDGSSDNTAQVANSHGAIVLKHPLNCGQGAALQTGITFALRNHAKYLVTFDADGQHSASDIPAMLQPLIESKTAITLGTRFLGQTVNMPWSRRILLKAAVLFTRIVSNIRVTDTHNGLRGFTADAATKIRIKQDRMAHASEILDEISRQGIPYTEVPVTIVYNEETLAKGQSGWGAFKIVGQLLMGRLVR